MNRKDTQRYYSDSVGIRIDDYPSKHVIFPDGKINLGRDFVRIKAKGNHLEI